MPISASPPPAPSGGRTPFQAAQMAARSAVRHRPGWPLSLAVVLLVAASCSPGTATLSSLPSSEVGSAPADSTGAEGQAAAPGAPSPTEGGDTASSATSGGDAGAPGDGPGEAAAGQSGGDPAAQAGGAEPSPPQPAPTVGELGEQEVRRPAVRVEGLDDVAGGLVEAAVAHEMVTFATAVARSSQVVADESGTGHDVALAAVDPGGLRLLVPEVTAKETALWQRLAEGDAVVDYHAADRLGIELGERLTVPGADGASLRVGGLAETGEPPVADVVVSAERGRSLGLPQPNALLASVEEGTPASRAAVVLQESLGGRAVALVDQQRLRGSGPHTRVVDVPDHVWHRLAQCESSGRWNLDSRNGYYGGLQFLPESWWWVGGTGMPHEATPQEQIRRAEVLLSVQGWDAWPVCSEQLGLRESVGTVDGMP